MNLSVLSICITSFDINTRNELMEGKPPDTIPHFLSYISVYSYC